MLSNRRLIFRLIGVAGTIACLAAFIVTPSFPTPDKLLIFLVFVFMIFSQALAMLRHLLPFVVVLLAYESFRGLADQLNNHVNYSIAPHADKLLFGNLPTAILQKWWWHGHAQWYDYVLYLPYLLHFILPIGLAILVWKTREKYYWRVVNTYIVVAIAAFITYFVLPAAPPWLASDNHYIQPVTRISSAVWAGLGLKSFPSFYNHISPNAVAAIPSLHAAWATLLVIFVWKLYGRRWGLVSATYPFLIFLGTVYEAEHYAFDVLAGIVYAAAGYFATPHLMRLAGKLAAFLAKNAKI